MEICKLHFYPDGNDGRVACMIPASTEVHDINGAMCFSMGADGKSNGTNATMLCVNTDKIGDSAADILSVCGPGMVLAMDSRGVIKCAARPGGGGLREADEVEQEEDEVEQEGDELEEEEGDELEEEEAGDGQDLGPEGPEGGRAGKKAAPVNSGEMVCLLYKAEDLTQCYSSQFMVPKDRLRELGNSMVFHKAKDSDNVAICTLDEVSKKMGVCVGLDFMDKTPYDMSSICADAEAVPILRRDGTFDCKLPSGMQVGTPGEEQGQGQGLDEADVEEEEREDDADDDADDADEVGDAQEVPVAEQPTSLELHEAVMPAPLPATSHQMLLPPYIPPSQNYAYAFNTMTYTSSDPVLASVYINRIQSM